MYVLCIIPTDTYPCLIRDCNCQVSVLVSTRLVSNWVIIELHVLMSRSLVFSDLTRGLWDDRDRLREGLMHADETGSGVLSQDRLRQLLRAHRLPMSNDLMECMLSV